METAEFAAGDGPPASASRFACLLSSPTTKSAAQTSDSSAFTTSRVRHSYGIALLRKNPKKNHRTEVLLIKRRLTYHFCSFVMGHYHLNENDRFLRYLFDNMTVSEKLDILSLNFDTIWYRAWLFHPERDNRIYSAMWEKAAFHIAKPTSMNVEFSYKNYRKKKAKFEQVFGRHAERLKQLLSSSHNVESLWEIPKGKKEAGESDLETACREFHEETSIPLDNIRLLSATTPVTHVYKDQDVVYRNTFFLAELRDASWSPRFCFNSETQLFETEYTKWVGAEEIDFLNMNRKLAKQLKIIFEKVRSTARQLRRLCKPLPRAFWDAEVAERHVQAVR